MNAGRRKEIEKARGLIDEAKSILETCQSDESEYHDNLPENMQSGDKGDRAQAAADALQEAVDKIDEISGDLDTAVE